MTRARLIELHRDCMRDYERMSAPVMRALVRIRALAPLTFVVLTTGELRAVEHPPAPEEATALRLLAVLQRQAFEPFRKAAAQLGEGV